MFDPKIHKVDLEMAIEVIKKDCKPFLKIIKNVGVFYRGVGGTSTEVIKDILYKKTVRMDRKSKGLAAGVASHLNAYLKKNGHCSRAESIMASADPQSASIHGHVFYVFPIGNFNYTWMHAGDLNWDWTYGTPDIKIMDGRSIFNAIRKKTLSKIPKNFFVSGKDINEAHGHEFEVWFKCKEYYLLTSRVKNEVIEKMIWR